jgi:hypothetical protein
MSSYIQDLTKQVAQPPIQYIQSANINKDIPADDFEGQVSSYFYPSMVFPTYIELVSATLMFNNTAETSTDKIVKLVIAENGGSVKPVERKEYTITHKKGELVTTVKFKPTIILDPHQSFYFFTAKEALTDSCLVLGYRNYNANFGNRIKTPLKKI